MAAPTRLERICRALVRTVARVGPVKRMLVHPLIARPGYWFATACGFVWGGVFSLGRIRKQGDVYVARQCPRWSFGRGGTTIGAVYLTHSAISDDILKHEAVHRAQWKRYGLALIPLYFAAGLEGTTNRFEKEAGLELGGYLRGHGRQQDPVN